MTLEDPIMKTYSHLLMEANETKILLLKDSYKPLVFIPGYESLAFELHFPPLHINLIKKLMVLERLDSLNNPN